MESAGTGSEERFRALFERCNADVAAYVRRRAPESSVEDVVEETFLVAWRSLERIHGDPLPWLYGVARRVLANQLRGQRRYQGLVSRIARECDHHEQVALGEGLSEQLRAALLALPERDREALLLIAWEGLTPAQAARVVGCSAPAFRARLRRGRRRLERALGALPGVGVRLAEEEA
jgi:RNA polymerase sigma-70 factor (ECF subfamily)